MKGLAAALSLVLFVACVHGLNSPRAREANGAPFRLSVHLDETFVSAEIGLLSPDGSRYTERVDGGRSRLSSSDWQQGPGGYVVAMPYVRVDGGTGLHTTPFEMRENDVEVSGHAVFWDGQVQLQLDLRERTPTGLRLEPASKISREGHARYVLTNTTSRRLYPGFFPLQTQHRSPLGWKDLGATGCLPTEPVSLEPGEHIVLEAAAGACLSEPLPSGEYRHTLRLEFLEPEPVSFDAPAEVARTIEVAHEFDSRELGSFSTYAFPDVPISELQVDSMYSGFVATAVSPDGRSACLCPGTFVGREHLQVTQGIGGLCATADMDASVTLCQPLGRRVLGDYPPFPFR